MEIMEGTNEGKFAWITVNYLLDSVAKAAHETFVVLDLGGGSTQVTPFSFLARASVSGQ